MLKKLTDLSETRRRNLRLLAKDMGAAVLGNALGYKSHSYVSQMVGARSVRPVTERTARHAEWVLGLEPGSLDLDLDDQP